MTLCLSQLDDSCSRPVDEGPDLHPVRGTQLSFGALVLSFGAVALGY